MNKARRVMTQLWGDFRLWLHAPRTLWMIMFMLVLCVLQVRRPWQGYLRDYSLYANDIIIYHFFDGFNLMMSSSIFLLGCSEMPKRITWQQQSLIRSSRRSWLFAYVGQCFLMVFLTITMMVAVTLLLSIGHIRPGIGWSELERISQMDILSSDSIISPFLMENTTPIQGVLMCLTPLMLFWFTMLLVILLFGMTSHPQIGLLICAFATLSYVCVMDFDGWVSLFAIYRYTSLCRMDLETHGIAHFGKVMMGYGIIDAGLLALMTIVVKHIDFALPTNVKC